jgi:hypothetical protein
MKGWSRFGGMTISKWRPFMTAVRSLHFAAISTTVADPSQVPAQAVRQAPPNVQKYLSLAKPSSRFCRCKMPLFAAKQTPDPVPTAGIRNSFSPLNLAPARGVQRTFRPHRPVQIFNVTTGELQ